MSVCICVAISRRDLHAECNFSAHLAADVEEVAVAQADPALCSGHGPIHIGHHDLLTLCYGADHTELQVPPIEHLAGIGLAAVIQQAPQWVQANSCTQRAAVSCYVAAMCYVQVWS